MDYTEDLPKREEIKKEVNKAMPKVKQPDASPAYCLEKEVVRSEIESGLQAGMKKLSGSKECPVEREDNFHNTKYLLKQYRRVEYSVHVSEAELNLRMELEHGVQLSTLEVNAELAGVDLTGTKLERYAQSVIRSKNMLEIINTALETVREDPDHGELLYHVLYYTYFTKQKPKNRGQILRDLDAKGFPMSISSYHNHLNAAVKAIDRILWGYTARDCIELIRHFLPE